MDQNQHTNQPDLPPVAGQKIIQPLDPERLTNELAVITAQESSKRPIQAVQSATPDAAQTPPPIQQPTPTATPRTSISKGAIRAYGAIAAITGVLTIIYYIGAIDQVKDFFSFLLYGGSLTWGFGCTFSGIGLVGLQYWGRSLLIKTFIISGIMLLPYLPFLMFLGVYSFASMATNPQVAFFIVPLYLTIILAFMVVFPKAAKEQLS